MKKFLLIGYFLFLFFATVSAQQAFKLITLPSLDSTTERTAFIRTPDNGFLIGTRQSGVTGWGSTMIKLDSAGNPVFAKQLTENISKIILCSDGGFLMLGTALIKTDSAL
ncbi:MAG: hypothetical protein ABI763_01510, partial [Bacteroidota bacterium]